MGGIGCFSGLLAVRSVSTAQHWSWGFSSCSGSPHSSFIRPARRCGHQPEHSLLRGPGTRSAQPLPRALRGPAEPGSALFRGSAPAPWGPSAELPTSQPVCSTSPLRTPPQPSRSCSPCSPLLALQLHGVGASCGLPVCLIPYIKISVMISVCLPGSSLYFVY